ncbi:unnamed protein product [Pylaiella littoralis]
MIGRKTYRNPHPPTAGGDLRWKCHFITRESWSDLGACILEFVSIYRYLFEARNVFRVDADSSNSRRFINPRTFSQDILEHRFAHIRAGLGTLRNSTAAMAKQCSVLRDLNRGLHGGSRMNSNRNARRGEDFEFGGFRGAIMLTVTDAERAATVRAHSRKYSCAVLCPRHLTSEPLSGGPRG